MKKEKKRRRQAGAQTLISPSAFGRCSETRRQAGRRTNPNFLVCFALRWGVQLFGIQEGRRRRRNGMK